MSQEEKIDSFAKSGLLTSEQAARAKQRLLELAEQAQKEGEPDRPGAVPVGDGV